MSLRVPVSLFAAVLLIGGASLAVRASRARAETDHELRAMADDCARLQRRIHQLRQSLSRLRRAVEICSESLRERGEATHPNGQTVYLGSGRVSSFGGPDDDGVDSNSLTAITHEPTGSLDPDSHYVALRWDYDRFPPAHLRRSMVRVVASNGRAVLAEPVCWGPARWTGRFADVSPGVLKELRVETDDEVQAYLVCAN